MTRSVEIWISKSSQSDSALLLEDSGLLLLEDGTALLLDAQSTDSREIWVDVG